MIILFLKVYLNHEINNSIYSKTKLSLHLVNNKNNLYNSLIFILKQLMKFAN